MRRPGWVRPTLRRALLWVTLLAVAGCKSLAARRLPDRVLPGDPILAAQLQRTYANVRATVDLSKGVANLVRENGYVYTVDVSQLLTYAALTRDSALYRPLRDFAVFKLISDTVADPYTRGFVLWRRKEGAPGDASGTTEGLRVAEGLWAGAEAFGDTVARNRAVLIVQGYARHAFEDQGVWLIRNYFNFQSRTFATNSFLVDYDPDFVELVATEMRDSALTDVARRSNKLVRDALTRVGLLYEIIQPEVVTALPILTTPIFSPNDIVSLMNSCTVAERVVRSQPDIGRGVLRFAKQHEREHANYFYGRTGEPMKENDRGVEPISCLLRLALKLGDQEGARSYTKELLRQLAPVRPGGRTLDFYALTEVLMALHLAERAFAS